MPELMVWSGDYNAAQREIAIGLVGPPGPTVLADYALGRAELMQKWGESRILRGQLRGSRALIDVRQCIHCGTCENRCTYGAIENLMVWQSRCQGCGECAGSCPAEAIHIHNDLKIDWQTLPSDEKLLVRVDAFNNAGIASALIKQRAAEKARELNSSWVISSGPAVIDNTLFVTLPGLALVVIAMDAQNLHSDESKRVVSISRQFQLPVVAVLSGAVHAAPLYFGDFCQTQGVEILNLPIGSGDKNKLFATLWQQLQNIIPDLRSK